MRRKGRGNAPNFVSRFGGIEALALPAIAGVRLPTPEGLKAEWV